MVIGGDTREGFVKRIKLIRNSMEFSHGIRRALSFGLMLVYMVSLGFDVVWITTLFAVSTVIGFLLEFPTGAVADYDSRKKSILISLGLFFVSFMGIFLFENFWMLAIFWILQDVAWTFSSGASSAWAIDALNYAKEKSKIVRLMSRGYLYEKLGHIIGGLIGFIIVAINFRFIWLAISLVYFGLFFVVWKYMEERNFKPEKVKRGYAMKSFIKAKESFLFIIHKDNRKLRVLFLGEMLGVASISSFFILVPLFITDILGYDPEFLSLIYSFIAVFAMTGSFVAERLVDRKGFRVSLFLVWILMGSAMVVFGFPHLILWSIVGLVIIEFAEVINDILEDSAIHHKFSSELRASLTSVSAINWGIANSASVFLTGLGIKFFGVVPMIYIASGVAFLTGFFYLVGLRE